MNCIILLFLLGCCGGWGNGCGRTGNCGCGGRSGCGGQNCGRMGNMRNCGCREEEQRQEDGDCGCEESHDHHHHHHHHEQEEEGCGCERNERESCDVPGMIPPPWQEYPSFPRRDNQDNCES